MPKTGIEQEIIDALEARAAERGIDVVDVEVVGRAPLRDPVALRLPGFTLSLRNNEADHIYVIPLEDENTPIAQP